MNDRDTRRYDVGNRVIALGKDSAADFAPASDATKHFANISRIIGQIDKARAGQKGDSATSKATLVDALRLDVQNIARTAAAIDQDEPGFGAKFRPPQNSNEGAVIAAADAILARLLIEPTDSVELQAAKTALAAKFIAKEMPADFAENLKEDRDAIDAAKGDYEISREGGVENTALIGQLVKELMKEINYLDAIMHNKYSRSPEKLRAWKSASHIDRAPQREKKPSTPAPPNP